MRITPTTRISALSPEATPGLEMKSSSLHRSIFAGLLWLPIIVGCGGGGSTTMTPPPPTTYTLTVTSTNPVSGVAIATSPVDTTGAGNGVTSFSRIYNSGTAVTLTAPATAGLNTFSSWTGCTTASGAICAVTLSGSAAVVANYAVPVATVTSVTVAPGTAALALGMTQQFTATVAGTGTFTTGVTWSVNGIAGGNAALGTVSSTGIYVTPFPAPSSVTVTANSAFDATKSGSATINLAVPTTAGPALAVDALVGQHPISPLIYGMNAYTTSANFEAMATDVHLPLDRWGGDAATRYNYQVDSYNSASDYYYESYQSSNAYPAVSAFNLQVERDRRTHSTTLGTIPLIGWTTKLPPSNPTCGFSMTKYGAQQKIDPYHPDCGNGVKPDGSTLTGNDPMDTSFVIDQTFGAGWVQYLVGKFGAGASGGIPIYDLDNEPEYWSFVHRDVHPAPMSYDELTTNGLAYAKAIKDADPTAQVSGFVVSNWDGFFYSPKDWFSGWGSGPDYVYNGNPVDRLAHGDVPFVEYYLQQFKNYDTANSQRLMDYVDIHTYFAAAGAGFAPAGATDLQAARLDSTRAFWDATYTDKNYTDPNNRTKAAAPVPPMLIPRLKTWVANDYPGTKVAIDEYNWGAQDHVNGAVAQADILGIFGREGLDLGALWGAPDAATQQPSVNAFKVFRNYDGAGAAFGDDGISATSTDQGRLSIYAAVRTSDHMLTVVVVNKSFSNLTSTIGLGNVVPTGAAKVFLYSNASLSSIVPQPDLAISGGALQATFPAQSITVLAVPQ